MTTEPLPTPYALRFDHWTKMDRFLRDLDAVRRQTSAEHREANDPAWHIWSAAHALACQRYSREFPTEYGRYVRERTGES